MTTAPQDTSQPFSGRMLRFEVSEEMLAVISTALAAQPYRMVAAVIAEMQRQVTKQLQDKI